MKISWKTIAIVFIVLFLAETTLFAVGYFTLVEEEEKTMQCYYEVCADYPQAYYEANVCTCYEYDLLGEYVVAKEQWIK